MDECREACCAWDRCRCGTEIPRGEDECLTCESDPEAEFRRLEIREAVAARLKAGLSTLDTSVDDILTEIHLRDGSAVPKRKEASA